MNNIPDYQTVMLPMLKITGDDKEHSFREVVEILAQEYNLSDEERKELLPSGTQSIFDNRIGWAKTYGHL
jgi:restriction system protein